MEAAASIARRPPGPASIGSGWRAVLDGKPAATRVRSDKGNVHAQVDMVRSGGGRTAARRRASNRISATGTSASSTARKAHELVRELDHLGHQVTLARASDAAA